MSSAVDENQNHDDDSLEAPGVTALLTVRADNEASVPREFRRIRLKGTIVSLGRAVSNDVVLTSHLQISRKHCVFTKCGVNWFIQDFSTNGICLNQTPVSKTAGTLLAQGDIVHMVPGGILVYDFRYLYQPSISRPRVASNSVTTEDERLGLLAAPPHPRRGIAENCGRLIPPPNLNVLDDDDSSSEASESLLSLRTSSTSEDENNDLDFEPPAPDPPSEDLDIIDLDDTGPEHGNTDPIIVEEVRRRPLPTSSTNIPGVQTLASKRTIANSNQQKTGGSPLSKRPKRQLASKLLVEIGSSNSSSESEELLELDDDPVVLSRKAAAKAKVASTGTTAPSTSAAASTVQKNVISCASSSGSSTVSHLSPQKLSPIKCDAPESVSTSTDLETTTDVSVIRKQMKYFMEKWKEVELDKKKLVLSLSMERESHANQLAAVANDVENQKEELNKNLLQIMEHELNCCICNEVFIQATVVDCGHTFCNFCISEWSKKKEDCPVCRTKMTHRTKHVEMENFVVRVHGMMTEEIRTKRALLIEERKRDAEEVEAKEAAEAVRLVAAAAAAMPLQINLVTPRGRRGAARGRGRGRGRGAYGVNGE